MEHIIRFEGISKRFDQVQALKDVTFAIPKGGVHALVGENGAGKSTLIRICGGVMPPDSGKIYFEGQPAAFRSAQDSHAAGISIVHQEIPICPHLTAAENIMLGRPLPHKNGMVDFSAINEHAQELFEQLGVDVDPLATAGRLSIAKQQLIEIAQALSLESKLIIMDEPTSALGKSETEHLFETIRQLVEQGITIIYVSHRLEEVFEISDNVFVLRDGAYIGSEATANLTSEKVVDMMVGREIENFFPKQMNTKPEQKLLSVRDLTVPGVFENVSFDLHRGEILGLVGLQGSGCNEVLAALFGRFPKMSGTVTLDGETLNLKNSLDAIKNGISYVPADRQGEGIFRPMSVSENNGLLILKRLARALGWVPPKPLRQQATEAVSEFGIRTASVDALITSLSGGNQQKVVVSRSLSTDPLVILMDDPTRGVDVGAKAEIHEILNQITAAGNAIILVSSELPEVLAMSDRVMVMYKGTVRGELSHAEAKREVVLGLATGAIQSLDKADIVADSEAVEASLWGEID